MARQKKLENISKILKEKSANFVHNNENSKCNITVMLANIHLFLHFFPINITFRTHNNTIHGILGIYLGLAEER